MPFSRSLVTDSFPRVYYFGLNFGVADSNFSQSRAPLVHFRGVSLTIAFTSVFKHCYLLPLLMTFISVSLGPARDRLGTSENDATWRPHAIATCLFHLAGTCHFGTSLADQLGTEGWDFCLVHPSTIFLIIRIKLRVETE